jgi:hypothetical protein
MGASFSAQEEFHCEALPSSISDSAALRVLRQTFGHWRAEDAEFVITQFLEHSTPSRTSDQSEASRDDNDVNGDNVSNSDSIAHHVEEAEVVESEPEGGSSERLSEVDQIIEDDPPQEIHSRSSSGKSEALKSIQESEERSNSSDAVSDVASTSALEEEEGSSAAAAVDSDDELGRGESKVGRGDSSERDFEGRESSSSLESDPFMVRWPQLFAAMEGARYNWESRTIRENRRKFHPACHKYAMQADPEQQVSE